MENIFIRFYYYFKKMRKFSFLNKTSFKKIHKSYSLKLKLLFNQYHHYGIHFHIIVFFLALNKFLKTNLILESGVGPGHSTKYINFYCYKNNIKSYSVDFNAYYLDQRVIDVKKFNKNSKFIKGDGYYELLKLVSKYNNKNISLLLDGPKGMRGLSLIYSCMLINRNIKFAMIDDVIENSTVFNSLKINKFSFNIYDLLKDNTEFIKNKKMTLKMFNNDKNNISKITKKNLFQKREWIIFKLDKNFYYPGILKPKLMKLLVSFKIWFIIRFLIKLDNILFKN